MESFVRRENLRRYRNLLVKTTDETQRSQLLKLIAEEERRKILQELDWSSPTEIVRRSSAERDDFCKRRVRAASPT